MSLRVNRLKALFLVGVVLLIAGLLVFWYSSTVISDLYAKLEQGGLSPGDEGYLRGSLDWWQATRVAVFEPISYVIIAIGSIFASYSVVYYSFASWYDSKRKMKKTKKKSSKDPSMTEKQNAVSPGIKSQRTIFPTIAGILAIIASFESIVFSLLGYADFLETLNYSYQVSPSWASLFAGIFGSLAFALGLTGGMMAIRRKRLVFALIGDCFLLLQGFITIIIIGLNISGLLMGITTIVLSSLSLILVALSHEHFP